MIDTTVTRRAFAMVRELGPFRALLAAIAQGDTEVAQLLQRTIDQARTLASGGAL